MNKDYTVSTVSECTTGIYVLSVNVLQECINTVCENITRMYALSLNVLQSVCTVFECITSVYLQSGGCKLLELCTIYECVTSVYLQSVNVLQVHILNHSFNHIHKKILNAD